MPQLLSLCSRAQNRNFRAHVPQLLKPVRPEPVLHSKGSRCREKSMHRTASSPGSSQPDKPVQQQSTVKNSEVAQSCLTATPWAAADQAPLSMGFSRQEYWSGVPFPSPGDLPNPGIEPRSPTLQADSLPSEPRNRP